MRFDNVLSLNNIDASVVGAQNSSAIDCSYHLSSSVHVVATGAGSPTGAVKVQVSNDKSNPTNWVDLATVTVSTTTAGNYLIPKFELAYQWIRVVYTKTSGTGNITAIYKSCGF